MGDERIGQGRDSVKQYLKDNPDVTDELEAKIRAKLLENRTGQTAAAAASQGVDVSADDFDDAN